VIITIPNSFGANDCIGCGKPLNKWNKHKYHNSKCKKKFMSALDNCWNNIELSKDGGRP
jgi:hypothetical protein